MADPKNCRDAAMHPVLPSCPTCGQKYLEYFEAEKAEKAQLKADHAAAPTENVSLYHAAAGYLAYLLSMLRLGDRPHADEISAVHSLIRRLNAANKRFFLDQDSSCHWYMVPEEHRQAWDAWTNLEEGDEAGGEAPLYAVRLPGPPSQVTFADPGGHE